jgi:hypothetical protein
MRPILRDVTHSKCGHARSRSAGSADPDRLAGISVAAAATMNNPTTTTAYVIASDVLTSRSVPTIARAQCNICYIHLQHSFLDCLSRARRGSG